MPTAPLQLLTPRLKLRRWQNSDLQPFAQMNASGQVMRHFPGLLTAQESDAMVGRMIKGFEEYQLGLWALELLHSSEFIGFAGLMRPNFEAHFIPCVEVGWRLSDAFWGKGYATEAARTAMDDGFDRLGLSEIVSMTSVHNVPSMKVMERLGMTRNPDDDFDHPKIAAGHRLSRHVLYRLRPDQRTW